MKVAFRRAFLLVCLATPAAAQFPRLAPPPPCKVVGGAPAYLTYWSSEALRSSRPKIVVLALVPEVDDANKLYLSIAIPERIRQRLARDPRIHVATEASVSRAFSEARSRADSAARILDADYVISGKLLVSGERQEVQLVMTRPGQTAAVWQATFRATTALRAVEEAAVGGLAKALKLPQTPPLPKGWPTTDAGYDALLAGDTFIKSTNRASLDSALFYYGRALTLEPASGMAASRLAFASVTLLERGEEIPGYPGTAGHQRVNELLARAFVADSSSEAWTVKAMLSRVIDPVRFNGALAYHARAIRRDPNDSDGEHQYGITLLRLGDTRGAETHFRRALALSPGRANTLAVLGALEAQASRWSAACALSNASIAAWPYDAEPYATRAQARLHLSDARDAFSDAELVSRLATGAWPEALRILIRMRTGNIDHARQQIQALTGRWLSPGTNLAVKDAEYMALAYLAMDDRRRAIESLKRARPVGTDLRVALRAPRLSAIRGDTAIARLIIEAEGRDRR